MNKRLVALITAAVILAMIPLASAGHASQGSRTYTKVSGICLSALPHNYLPTKSMNAVLVYYTIHQPFQLPRHGVFMMQHVTFTGAFVGQIRHCYIYGEFAGTPILT
jgi:hypothetical protein